MDATIIEHKVRILKRFIFYNLVNKINVLSEGS